MWLIHLDIKENRLADKYVTDAVIKREINGNDTLEFTTYDHNSFSKEDHLLYKTKEGEWREFVIKGIDGNKNGTLVYAENSIVGLKSDYIDDSRVIKGQAKEALRKNLEWTKWEVGTVVSDKLGNWNAYHTNPYEGFSKILEAWGLEFETEIKVVDNKVVKRYINLSPSLGRERGLRFEYKKNLEDVTRIVKKEEIYTAVYGWGKGEELESGGYGRRISFADINGGKAYVADEEARKVWGKIGSDGQMKHRFTSVIFDKIEDPYELKNATIGALDKLKKPLVEYKTSVFSLQNLTGVVTDERLGDWVTVIDDDLEIEVKARITAIEEKIDDNEIELTIGNFYDTDNPLKQLVSNSVSNHFEDNMGRLHAEIQNVISGFDGIDNYFGNAEPTNPKDGDVWYRKNQDGTQDLLRYDGEEWILVVGDMTGKEIASNVDEIAKQAEQLSDQIDNIDGVVETTIDNTLQGLVIKSTDGTNRNLLNITPQTTYIQDATISGAMIKDASIGTAKIGTIDASKANIVNISAKNLVADKAQFIEALFSSNNSILKITSDKIVIKNEQQNWLSGIQFDQNGMRITYRDTVLGTVGNMTLNGKGYGLGILLQDGYHITFSVMDGGKRVNALSIYNRSSVLQQQMSFTIDSYFIKNVKFQGSDVTFDKRTTVTVKGSLDLTGAVRVSAREMQADTVKANYYKGFNNYEPYLSFTGNDIFIKIPGRNIESLKSIIEEVWRYDPYK